MLHFIIFVLFFITICLIHILFELIQLLQQLWNLSISKCMYFFSHDYLLVWYFAYTNLGLPVIVPHYQIYALFLKK